MFVDNIILLVTLLKMTAEMTADYIMLIWLVQMTSEMTAGYID